MSPEPQLTGMAKTFNSVTFTGRANVAKATYAGEPMCKCFFFFSSVPSVLPAHPAPSADTSARVAGAGSLRPMLVFHHLLRMTR